MSAASIVAPHVRDLSELSTMLASWLAARMPRVKEIRVDNLRYPLGAGMSHETILFNATWREDQAERTRGLVVRIKPIRDCVYADDLFVQQTS